jgi:protein ImuA
MEQIQYESTLAAPSLERLRTAVARIERGASPARRLSLPFGLPALDAALPCGGLAVDALHEVMGTGPDLQHAAIAARFAAGVLARRPGPVLWVLERADLFAPGLAGAGLHPDRVIYARAGRDGLLAMEEGLRHHGLAGVVGELSGPLSLTASRRLQLAAEASGVMALVLRRPWHAGFVRASGRDGSARAGGRDGAGRDGEAPAGATSAATRWQVSALPSPPVLPHAPDVPGLGRVRWQLDLLRCRGGRTGSWNVEACDAQGRLGLVPALADRPAAAVA